MRYESFAPGDLYSMEASGDKGGFSVVKVLVVDDLAVHICLYSNWFETRPDSIDVSTLYFSTSDDEEFGIAHLPFTPRVFRNGHPEFLVNDTVNEDELYGYRMWQEAEGAGVFGADEESANALNEEAAAEFERGNTESAIELNEEALAIWRGIGNRFGEASTLHNMGIEQTFVGPERAVGLFEEALPIWHELGEHELEDTCRGNLDALNKLLERRAAEAEKDSPKRKWFGRKK